MQNTSMHICTSFIYTLVNAKFHKQTLNSYAIGHTRNLHAGHSETFMYTCIYACTRQHKQHIMRKRSHALRHTSQTCCTMLNTLNKSIIHQHARPCLFRMHNTLYNTVIQRQASLSSPLYEHMHHTLALCCCSCPHLTIVSCIS
jgi:hypothetical protein